MKQSETDEAEWANPANWYVGALGIYASRNDSRAFVPKKSKRVGVAINFGHPAGAIFALVLLGLIVFMAVTLPAR